MTKNVTVIDYGSSNLLNVVRAFEHCGASVRVASTPADIGTPERLVLPGVGAFANCMNQLRRKELIDPIQDYARNGYPILGICLGMQVLLDESDEFGNWSGLGLIPGRVEKIPSTGSGGERHKIPHIGWNELVPNARNESWQGSVLKDLPDSPAVYFVHSYMAVPLHEEHCFARCDYNGVSICSVVKRDSVVGCQFHPEKSGSAGLQIIQNFLDI